MFTGLIETTAVVKDRPTKSLVLSRPASFDDISVGSSIAVSGVCLSVTNFTAETMRFDLLEETLKRTTLGSLSVGDFVNLERAMKIGDRFGGHIVQGHVDGVGQVGQACPERVRRRRTSRGVELVITYPEDIRGFIVGKGSIAVDGVSLTVVSVHDASFSVALIPETLRETTLGNLHEGSRVNIEADIIGKYVEMASMS